MSETRRWLLLVALVTVTVLGSAGEASAQGHHPVPDDRSAPGIRASIAAIDFALIDAPVQNLRSKVQAQGGRQRSTGRKVAGGIIGGVGGFFGGGYLGAAIEGDRCQCDDPGLMAR
jgi:hypothetical protein